MILRKSLLSKVAVVVIVLFSLNMSVVMASQPVHRLNRLNLTRTQVKQINRYLAKRNSPKPLTQEEFQEILKKIGYRQTRSAQQGREIPDDVYNAIVNAPVKPPTRCLGVGVAAGYLLAVAVTGAIVAWWIGSEAKPGYGHHTEGAEDIVDDLYAHKKTRGYSVRFVKDSYGRIFVVK